MATLAEHPNIVGIKESGSDIGQIAEYVSRTPDDFTVLAGSATTFVHALCAGCDGGVLALAALVPRRGASAWLRWCEEDRLEEARALQRRLMPLARAVGAQYGVPGLKAALELMGFAAGAPRAAARAGVARGRRDVARPARCAGRVRAGVDLAKLSRMTCHAIRTT